MHHQTWQFCLLLVVAALATDGGVPAIAEVAVFSNRTPERLTVWTTADGERSRPLTLAVGESLPVFYSRTLRIRYMEGLTERSYKVPPKSAYFFTRGRGDGRLRMERIGFGKNKPAPSEPGVVEPREATIITVKLLVDDDEPTHRQIWEAKLRKRLGAASKILERHSGIKLKVVDITTWDSDDRLNYFPRSLREFEQEVNPKPAQLAIGFSSQYQLQTGRVHMGGTRGALHPYILLKERSRNVLEPERLELLVHELGHYLGASHSPEPTSVMRPLLTGGLQRRAGARVQFDPVNTLLIAMLGDEMRTRKVRRLAEVSPPTRLRMSEIYSVLAKALPRDPAASQYLQLLGQSGQSPTTHVQPAPQDQAMIRDTNRTMAQLLRVVKARRPDDLPNDTSTDERRWYTGDQLTEFYVRQAALAAIQLRPEQMERVFLLTLGIFLDDVETLSKLPATAGFASGVETNAQRKDRLSILNHPTMRDRRDLARHFFVSAFLTTTFGPEAALNLGLSKEMLDANGGSGFSFADLVANRAGIEFAKRVSTGKISLEDLNQNFAVADYLPEVDDLDEGIEMQDFRARFGKVGDEAFQAEMSRIEQRVLDLPIYRRAMPATN